ncbi:eukaryotic translation initiation factor 2-alpha kinase 1-like [Euwallacea similis]|uniref:eukaryotic translation initiation factor 2-alpha kinase 1-like n=1 Tax=Euwallacea similis TaxID=1736056 RepID=UPI00344F6C67
MPYPNKAAFGKLGEPLSKTEASDEDEDTSRSTSLTVAKRPFRSTRVSLLIEALVKNLISMYEPDRRRIAHAYKKICRRLFQMGLIDESWQMTELEGARVQFEHVMFQLFSEGITSSPASPIIIQGAYYTSQYRREFDEYQKIGGGAFGKVFRVKHKLDGTEYAVKKIPIRSERIDSVKKYLSEVKTFAILNHPNIVQYKAAWLELGAPTDIKAITHTSWDSAQLNKLIPSNSNTDHNILKHRDSSSSPELPNGSSDKSSSSTSSTSNNNGRVRIPKQQTGRVKLTPVETELFLPNHISESSLTCTKPHENSSNFEVAFENSSTNNQSLSKVDKSTKNVSPTENPIILSPAVTHRNDSKPKILWATLYIQMALCHGTLGQWLRRRNESFNADVAVTSNGAEALRTKAIRQILIQILRGLKYIHSKGIVHHDIKPSNIFVSNEGGSLLVQVGDFGLACPLQASSHEFARGTPLYAAPEQLAGRCDPKSDMYSLGIVLFELLEDFSTEMERTKKISELRSRRDLPVPSELSLSNLVSALVRHSPGERPDAATLLTVLENITNASPPDLEALERRLREKDLEIERLRALLRKHGVKEV